MIRDETGEEYWIWKDVIDGNTGEILRKAEDRMDGEYVFSNNARLLKINGRIWGVLIPTTNDGSGPILKKY